MTWLVTVTTDRQLNSAAISAYWSRRRELARKTGTCMGYPGYRCNRPAVLVEQCAQCAERERERWCHASKRKYQFDKAEGRCVRCGERLEGVDIIYVSCTRCRRKVNERRRRSEPYFQKGLVK